MKILSGAQGDGLLTNLEVLEWLKEKNFDIQRRHVPDGVIKPPSSTATIARNVRRYLEASPSGAETSKSARALFEKLQKFNLSVPELLMIVNIRPEAYAHLTALMTNVYSRFDEDQLYEILEIVNGTLEKRARRKPSDEPEPEQVTENIASPNAEGQDEISPVHIHETSRATAEGEEEVSAQITDMTTGIQSVQAEHQVQSEAERPSHEHFENGIDATIVDYSVYTAAERPSSGPQSRSQRRATT